MEHHHRIENYLKEKGTASPRRMAQALNLSRRTLGRHLVLMSRQGKIVRAGRTPTDPNATYQLSSSR